MEPWLHDATYQQRVWCLTGFSACVRLVLYDRGGEVAIGTVSGALSAVGMTVALAYEGNPTTAQGEKTLVPRLAQMMEGWKKEDPSAKKTISVGIDVPAFLEELGMEKDVTKMLKSVGNCAIITFYYLLRVGEYTVKKHRNEKKQMVQFKLEDTNLLGDEAVNR